MVSSGDYVYELLGQSSVHCLETGKVSLGEPVSYGLFATSQSASIRGSKLVEDETIEHFTVNVRRIH